VQDRRCQMKAAAIGIARNGAGSSQQQHAGSQWGTPPQNRHGAENHHSAENRHSAENAAADNAATESIVAEMTTRSAEPAAADWTEMEAEVTEAAMLAERNNDTEMETSGTAPPMTQ
jgi:hypothetical protein